MSTRPSDARRAPVLALLAALCVLLFGATARSEAASVAAGPSTPSAPVAAVAVSHPDVQLVSRSEPAPAGQWLGMPAAALAAGALLIVAAGFLLRRRRALSRDGSASRCPGSPRAPPLAA